MIGFKDLAARSVKYVIIPILIKTWIVIIWRYTDRRFDLSFILAGHNVPIGTSNTVYRIRYSR